MKRCGNIGWIGWAVCLVLSLGGCDNGGGTAITPPPDGGPRIVSLSPILTQMVVDLGLGRELVGVAEQDGAAPAGVATVGTAQSPNLEKIRQLQPTHIVMLVGDEGTPQAIKDLASKQGAWLAAYPQPTRVNDVAAILHDDLELIVGHLGLTEDDDIDASADAAPVARPKSLGFVMDRQKRASDLRLEMMFKLQAIHRVTNNHLRRVEQEHELRRQTLEAERREMLAAIDLIDDPSEREQARKAVPEVPPTPALRPAVLLVTETDPLTVVGPGRVLDDLLDYVGASNAASETKEPAPTFDRDKLVRYLNPQLPDAPASQGGRADPLTGLPVLDDPRNPGGVQRPGSDPAANPGGGSAGPGGGVGTAASLGMPARLMPPDFIAFLEPHGSKLGAVQTDSRLRVFHALDVPAVKDGRFVLIDDPQAKVPGTSLVRVATALAKAIYPQLEDEIDRAVEHAMEMDGGVTEPADDLLRQPLPFDGAGDAGASGGAADSRPRFAPPGDEAAQDSPAAP